MQNTAGYFNLPLLFFPGAISIDMAKTPLSKNAKNKSCVFQAF